MTVLERVVDSPADLRRLIERARADPHVVAFPYRQARELVGDEPQQCHNGHGYAGGSATTPMRDWWPRRCGRPRPRHTAQTVLGGSVPRWTASHPTPTFSSSPARGRGSAAHDESHDSRHCCCRDTHRQRRTQLGECGGEAFPSISL
ncbi:hypothetical protein [Micromonospora inositola]|uniref:hypothetical protein n=1 Tax=Micromonospora inositola TaxID=47865 RepID=UPI0012FDCC30|nr:hypothetical protein [Micromonospora inositola]